MEPHQYTRYTNVDTWRKRIVVWHFQLIAWYRVSFVYICGSLASWRAKWNFDGLLLHQPKDCEWYLSFFLWLQLFRFSLATFNMLFGLCVCVCVSYNKPASIETWILAFSQPLSGVVTRWRSYSIHTCYALQTVRYHVQVVWERQLQLCRSYFMLLLLKKNSPLTQTPRQSTF